jgi:hypothetical protein
VIAEAARQYFALGLSVIPVGRNKHPLIGWKTFQTERPTLEMVEEWFAKWPTANVGTVTGAVSNLVVLDADGPEGLESLKGLSPPASTWLAKTGRPEGGWQQFFKHPGAGVVIGNRAGIRPGLDVRADGGYVILPPSLHASGIRYQWLTAPDRIALAPLPEELRHVLLTPEAPAAVAAGQEIPEGQRNHQLYRLARSLVARRMSPTAIIAAVLEENRLRCRPALPESEVRKLVAHAIEQPDRQDFARDVPQTIELLGGGLGDFLAQMFPPVESYIEGILSADGGGWIGGEEKTNKTWWALAEALGLAFGEPVAGHFSVPAPRRVLFIEEEDSPRRTHRRLRALLRGLGYDADDPVIRETRNRQFRIEVWSGFTLDEPAMVARLEATIADFKPEVVYLDVLRKVTLRDLNKAAEAGALLAELDRLRRSYAVIFRIVHHYRKTQGFRAGRGSQEIGGSFVLGAWAENSLFFEPVGRKQGAVRVAVQCKDLPPAPDFTLRLEFEGAPHDPALVRLLAEEITTESKADSTDEMVYQAVTSCPATSALAGRAGAPIDAIMAAVKKSNPTVRRSLDRLIDAGRVEVTGTMIRKKKLYGIPVRVAAYFDPAHSSGEQA